MTPEEYIQSGDVQGALDCLKDLVRNNPADVKYRISLFQVMALLGDWERSLTQLNVAGEMDDSALAMMHMYRDVISCEAFREQVFKGEKDPVFLGKPESWGALWLQSMKLHADNQHKKAQALQLQALEMVEDCSGSINGEPFEWIVDADSRLGPVLEVIVEGRYLWTPFSNIQKIMIDAPENLRDLVWMPAHFRWQNGGESYGLIPTRYPESYRFDDPILSLSRKTEWDKVEPDTWLGKGQRSFMTDSNDYSLMDVRTIELNPGKSSATDNIHATG